MVNYRQQELDSIFAALADPTRRGILERVARHELTVTELAADFPISLPAISRHLRILAGAGLLEQSKEGRFRRCSLNSRPLRAAAAWLERYEEFWSGKFDRLDDLLSASQPPKRKRHKPGRNK
ncbi:MAG: metalloregulator ArsR/SmtB family transcription factor [Ignavibacteria bacterium]|nr:metalloregulator ArsR/SmtB family transcription factor [Ignavibacteria bacterium]